MPAPIFFLSSQTAITIIVIRDFFLARGASLQDGQFFFFNNSKKEKISVSSTY